VAAFYFALLVQYLLIAIDCYALFSIFIPSKPAIRVERQLTGTLTDMTDNR
jgi:predicted CDP-diglyceride synthetase/phosphatidate cytidylyltransferase